MDLPPLPLDRAAARPLAVQLADGLRAATADGAVRAGDRLPSTRALAAVLGVSRTVTAAAYDQLLAEGWVEGRRGAGTFVVGVPPPATRPATTPPATTALTATPPTPTRPTGSPPTATWSTGSPPAGRPTAATPTAATPAAVPPRRPATAGSSGAGRPAAGGTVVDLRAGTPCLHVLDRAAWRRAWRAAGDAPPDAEPEPAGLPAFRAAVVEHLLRHRGLPADPSAVLATGGSTGAVAELARTLPAGARVAVEEPGYRRAVTALREAGLRVLPVPVDASGLVVAALPPGLAAVCTTPAHQYPLGARLSAARRVELVERARAERFLVVEDDYDGELRYDVAPLPLLAALGPDVVVHLGTVSKLLTPTLGVGWLVAPPAVAAALLAARDRTGARPARAGQRVFAALAASGDLSRHLRRLRRELAARRAEVLAALPARGDAAGAHVVVPLRDGAAERAVLAAAAGRGVLLDGLARHHLGDPSTAGLVLGYAGPPRAVLRRALEVVASAVRAAG